MSNNNWLDLVQQNRGTGSRKKDLSMMKRLMKSLGNPERKTKYIHVAGTNGKGSTSTFISSVLRQAGYSVGLFTSPHLETICERIRIDEELISLENFEYLMEKVGKVALAIEKETVERYSAFELLTAVAFLYFAEKMPDIVVLEVGVGGRLDGTNIIPAENTYATVVTSIGLDHMGVLGNTEVEIAYEKAGIFKSNVPAFIGDFTSEVKEVFVKKAQELEVPLYQVDGSQKQVKEMNKTTFTQKFTYEDRLYEIQMLGIHQIENACLAILVTRNLSSQGVFIDEKDIAHGVRKAFWAGRMEKINDNPLLFVDGAHNKMAVERLVETLKEQFSQKHFSFVIGMMKDKDYEEMIDLVWNLADRFIVVRPDPIRGFDAQAVAHSINERGKPAIAVENADEVRGIIKKETKEGELWIQFGSLYLVGSLKTAFKKEK